MVTFLFQGGKRDERLQIQREILQNNGSKRGRQEGFPDLGGRLSSLTDNISFPFISIVVTRCR